MKTPCRIALIVACVLVSFPLIMRAAESTVPFRALSFDAATKAATAEGKLVFIDFYTTWCAPCKMLDEQTWTDAAVGKLVGEKAVALKLDAEKDGRDVAQRYKIDAYPTLLLLKPDGTEIDRLVGFRESSAFISEFNAALAGKPSLARATEAVTAAGTTQEAVKARYDLARELMRSHKSAEALQEYLWCFDEGMVQVPSYAGVRLSFLLGDLDRLAKIYPPARAALEERCDAAEKRLLADATDRRAGADFAALATQLGQDERVLAVFNRLPAGDPRRAALGFRAYKLLREKQRYRDASEIMPYAFIARTLDLTLNRPPPPNLPPSAVAAERQVRITNLLDYVEVLAGAGDLEHARELIGRLLSYDDTPATKTLLAQRLEKARQPDLLADK